MIIYTCQELPISTQYVTSSYLPVHLPTSLKRGRQKILRKTIQTLLRPQNITLVREIHQHNIRHLVIQPLTQARLRTNTSIPTDRVRRRGRQSIRHERTQDVNIEEVIDDIHAAGSGGARGSVDGAVGEGRVGDVVGGLEEIGEFIKDVGDGGGICAVVCIF